MKLNNNVEKDMYSFLSSAGLLAANGYFEIMPGVLPNVGLMALTSIAGGMVVNDVFGHKWEKIFKTCGLSNKEGETPQELNKQKTDKGMMYTFSIPKGLSLSSFIAKQTELEMALDQELMFKISNNKLYMYYCNGEFINWQRIFKNCQLYNNDGLMPEIIKEEQNKLGSKYVFKLPPGVGLKKIEDKKEMIISAVKQPMKFDLTKDYNLVMQVYDLEYKDTYKPSDYNIKITPNNLRFYTGITLTADGEQTAYFDLNRSNSHLLICGMSGKGKTILTRYLVAQAMLKNNTKVYISDLKATGAYNKFKKCKNLNTITKSAKDTYKMIEELEDIMLDRYKTLDELDLNDQMEYNKKHTKKMHNIILLIEEFVTLSRNQDIIEKLNVLLSQGSGAGIFIWLTVQRPCAKTMDTRLKSNLSYTIAFRAKNSSNSEVYLDKGDYRATELLEKAGEAILVKEQTDILFKAFYLNTEEIEKMVKHTYIEKKEKTEEKKELKLID
jgi:S-DNA-T family DNA segregation ATPase FtsK/SpoIIIE